MSSTKRIARVMADLRSGRIDAIAGRVLLRGLREELGEAEYTRAKVAAIAAESRVR